MSVATDYSGNPILEQFGEDGFVDCVFRISDLIESPDFFSFPSFCILRSHRPWDGCSDSEKTSRPGFDNEMNLVKDHVYREGVSFHSIRNRERPAHCANCFPLCAAPRGGEMISKETFTAIALHQGEIESCAPNR